MEENFFGFKNSCNQLADGSYDRGPGIACWILLFSQVISLITAIISRIDDIIRWKRRELVYGDPPVPPRMYIKAIIGTIIQSFLIYFMYKMCYICNPYKGFGVMVILSSISAGVGHM